jgi:hypothetical protein
VVVEADYDGRFGRKLVEMSRLSRMSLAVSGG